MPTLQACGRIPAYNNHSHTLCATQLQMNLTTSLLHDMPTFDGWDTSKLEEWISDIEAAADILKESCAHLAKTNHMVYPTHSFVRHFNLGNAGMTFGIYFSWNYVMWTHTPTYHFLWRSSRVYTTAIYIFVKGLQDAHNIAAKIYKKEPQTLLEIIKLVQHSTRGYSYLNTPYSQYNVKEWPMFCMQQDRSHWSPLPLCAVL